MPAVASAGGVGVSVIFGVVEILVGRCQTLDVSR